ncbi:MULTISPECIES: DUF6221 family protein [Micromonospora]|uniref:DUF6221 family protein n=1 Tax=Micromonospora TaxID=1873 RepID=UPI001EE87D12|nr:DUF6221 family protein [Micromonospora hortensis]MCG5452247.1 DUF6221 family protein [Micromonospora hortensis]WTI10058.1 DUF6221 family protein [Micromonospora sp. NBC_00821]
MDALTLHRTCGDGSWLCQDRSGSGHDPSPSNYRAADEDQQVRGCHLTFVTNMGHAYVDVFHRFGSEALLDSQLPMLDLVDMLAREYEAMDPGDERFAGLAYALRVLVQSYNEHPDYRKEWRPPVAVRQAPVSHQRLR